MRRLVPVRAYLPPEAARDLDARARAENWSRSEAVCVAVLSFLAPDGADANVHAIGRGLDRLARQGAVQSALSTATLEAVRLLAGFSFNHAADMDPAGFAAAQARAARRSRRFNELLMERLGRKGLLGPEVAALLEDASTPGQTLV